MVALVMSFELRWRVVTFDDFVDVRIGCFDNLLAILAVELNRLLLGAAALHLHFCTSSVIGSAGFDR
ncbi:hypothetical protein D3C85_1715370 [compost metagenome]